MDGNVDRVAQGTMNAWSKISLESGDTPEHKIMPAPPPADALPHCLLPAACCLPRVFLCMHSTYASLLSSPNIVFVLGLFPRK